ncbi:MAG: undecaprenyldiphospho-muramoylpentapeptide beta-N-acetylglucosaminyltransferase [Candidatus Latescibacteria bacterium]|nr:undecaprenyldiphospho-muramoylpentapeptide beta-N-acetylglucosaminyltransferase [Candidatus Latescibacterota bacterium]
MRIMFAGGGTGGHIYPALAVAEEIKQKRPETEFLFVGGTRGVEQKIISSSGFPVKTIPVTALPRTLSPDIFSFIGRLGVSIIKSRSYIRKFKPGVIMATGSYISGASMIAAISLGVPVVIQEQNSFPGITNRKLGRYAKIVFLGFEDAGKYFGTNSEVHVTGNPVRKDIGAEPRETSAQAFGFDPTRKTVFVFGGSQGAQKINKTFSEIVESIADSGIQVLWQTGEKNAAKWASYDGSADGRIRTYRYIDNMAQAYAASDLVVARAGAMSITEITVCGLPAVFVPLPTAAANHQEHNARTLVNAGAASVIFERELTPRLLEQEITRIVTSDERLAVMSKASAKLGKKNAARTIAGILIDRYGQN